MEILTLMLNSLVKENVTQEFKRMNEQIYFKDNWMLIPYTRALRYIFQVHQKWNILHLSQAVPHLFPNQDMPPELYTLRKTN